MSFLVSKSSGEKLGALALMSLTMTGSIPKSSLMKGEITPQRGWFPWIRAWTACVSGDS